MLFFSLFQARELLDEMFDIDVRQLSYSLKQIIWDLVLAQPHIHSCQLFYCEIKVVLSTKGLKTPYGVVVTMVGSHNIYRQLPR